MKPGIQQVHEPISVCATMVFVRPVRQVAEISELAVICVVPARPLFNALARG